MIQLFAHSRHVVHIFATLLSFAECLNHGFVLDEFGTAGARPRAGKPTALLAIGFCAFFRDAVMFLE